MSIIDGTNLPKHVKKIKAKKAEKRTQIEQAVLDYYDERSGGTEMVIRVTRVEEVVPIKAIKVKSCLFNNLTQRCARGSNGAKCAICNPSGKI